MKKPYSIYLVLLIFVMIVALLSNCSGWLITIADNSPQKLVQIKEHTFKGKVIVIGAGASGLAAVTLLKKHGVDCQIIEATDHYGGRVQKNSEFADFPIDLGAEWIHQKKNILNRLIDRVGDEPKENLIDYKTLNAYSWDGENYSKYSELILKLKYWSFPEYKFKNTTWYQYLTENFAKKVEGGILYNAPVTQVNYSNKGVEVTTKNGEKYFADKVIVTVPLGVLKANHIQFKPALPKEKNDAIQAIEFLRGFKLILKFSQKFYPDLIECQAVGEGEKTYYDIAFGKEAKEYVLGLLTTGVLAEEYYKLGSEGKIIEAVLKELDLIFDGQASSHYTGEHLFKDWGRHTYTLGTYIESEAGLTKKMNEALSMPIQQKVYFAGEAYSLYRQKGTVQGAIMAGYEAVYVLLQESK